MKINYLVVFDGHRLMYTCNNQQKTCGHGGRGKGEEIQLWDGVQGVLLHCFDGEEMEGMQSNKINLM
jgi:hypothetical protein